MSDFKGILDAYGRPVNAERVRIEKESRFNPLRNLTPDVMVRQLEAFSRGEIAQFAYTAEWLEIHDDTIAVVAPKAKAAVSRYGWDVEIKPEVRDSQKGMAEDQRGKMEQFYQTVETSDAIELEEQGGMRLLVHQVMDAYGKRYGAHHIIWRPDRNGLRASLVKVPTWMFEVTCGYMRFLTDRWAIHGVDLSSLGGRNAWLTAKGRGVMLPSGIARMFKQIPLQDWLTYCDRHGMPAFLGKTSATKGQGGWNDMVEAVRNIGSEFGAVVNTGDVIEVVTLTGQGEVPYEKLIDRMDRAIVMLWRGGDLSTISRSNAVGSNAQQEESDELDADNAAWVGETLDRQLTKRVIEYYYGVGAPVLVQTKIRTKTRQNVPQDLRTVKEAKTLGIRVSKPWFVSNFGVQEAGENELALGETVLPGKAVPTVSALNSATSDVRVLLETTLAQALGVRTQILAPLRPLIEDAASRSHDGRISDADFLQLIEDAASSFPELIEAGSITDLAEQLNAAMGTAALQGARAAIRSASNN